MSIPITTLQDIVTLASQQYGIRFQVSVPQLVKFANIIQHIAYNKDIGSFIEDDLTLYLGHDVFLKNESSYVSPASTDIGLDVSGSTSGVIGKLINYVSINRSHLWIIEPPDGGAAFAPVASETLTIVGGSAATGNVAVGQEYPVSLGPYPFPKETTTGVKPVRKILGISSLSDAQRHGMPDSKSQNSDYGLPINPSRYSRYSNFPIKIDNGNQEITLISDNRPEITQTEESYGDGDTTQNTSIFRWRYYFNPPAITSISDNANIILPEEYRYEILFMGISRLADVATYGESRDYRSLIEPLCMRFWEDMSNQENGYGSDHDYLSDSQGWLD